MKPNTYIKMWKIIAQALDPTNEIHTNRTNKKKNCKQQHHSQSVNKSITYLNDITHKFGKQMGNDKLE